MEFHVVIPARLESSRLPRKVLLDIKGKPMIECVYNAAVKSGAKSVTVAADDQEIVDAVKAFGGQAILTSVDHTTGTDRLAEAAKVLNLKGDDILVGLQADEPLIPSSIIQQVAENVACYEQASMATLCIPIEEEDDIFNPNIVKVVMDQSGYALYFSRAPIPWDRDAFNEDEYSENLSLFHRHIGMYAYRVGFLEDYVSWEKSDLENCERLEQLRVLYHGHKIHVAKAIESPGVGVDTEDDLALVRSIVA